MKTPLFEAVNEYRKKASSRFHTPGLKGKGTDFLESIAPYDVTEIPGLDSLYEANGAIAESEREYTKIYGSKGTLFSAGGSTLCIQTMLALIAKPEAKVVVNRNAHTSVIHALALLTMEPIWVYPTVDGKTGLQIPVTPEQIKNILQDNTNVVGVFITSPDYYGQNCDIKGIAEVCREKNIPLLVDAAHGTHYKFVEDCMHPIDAGADLSCNSMHKTMPSLTGAALLHINNDAYLPMAKQRMALFGSTSPSYPIMLSMDVLIPYLQTRAKEDYIGLVARVAEILATAKEKGFYLSEQSHDSARMTLGYGGIGYTKEEFTDTLELYQIEPEYMDDYYCVLLPSTDTRERDWARVEKMVRNVSPKEPRVVTPVFFEKSVQRISLQKAMFANTIELPIRECIGRIAGTIIAPCPPGIPLAIPGEEITESIINQLESSGFFTVNVL